MSSESLLKTVRSEWLRTVDRNGRVAKAMEMVSLAIHRRILWNALAMSGDGQVH